MSDDETPVDRIKVVYTLRHRLHHPEWEVEASRFQEPFEHPGRAEAIRSALARDPLFEFVAPDEWGLDPITDVHDPGLVAFLESAWEEFRRGHGPVHDVFPDVFAHGKIREGMGELAEPAPVSGRFGWWCFETTTPLTEGTYEAARSAVDVALSATDHVLRGDRVAYGLCRPPGHHAARSVYGGYCFLNNAAVAAQHAATAVDGKVTVLDVDFHHGNGTQQIFYDRPDVQYISLHGDPVRSFPYYTGFRDEVGAGDGRGTTSNHPLIEDITDEEYLEVLSEACAEVAAFGPDLLVVSLGLDTYFADPICDAELTPDGFEACGAMVRELDMPTVVVQEGGYDDDYLGENARRWLHGVVGR